MSKIIRTNLYNRSFNDKTIASKFLWSMANNMWKHPQAMKVEDFYEKITNGYSFMAGIFPVNLKGNPKDTDLVEQWYLSFDIDNQDKELSSSTNKIKLTNGYLGSNELIKQHIEGLGIITPSFNYKPEFERYHVIFPLSEPLVNHAQVETLMAKLWQAIDHNKAIDFLTNSNRIVFGGNQKPLYTDLNAELDVEKWLGKNWRSIAKVDEATANWLALNRSKNVSGSFKPCSSINTPEPSSTFDRLLTAGTPEADKALGDFLLTIPSFASIKANDEIQYIKQLKRVPMDKMLGEPFHSNFLDHLHDEAKPSAHIEKNGTGFYLYVVESETKVFYDERGSNVGSIIEYMRTLRPDFKTTYDVVNYLLRATGKQLTKSEVVAKFKEMVESYITNDLQSDTLRQEFPDMAKIFKSRGLKIAEILRQMSQAVWFDEEKGEFSLMNYFSQRYLSDKVYGKANRAKEIGQMVNYMAYVGLLKKLGTKEIPKDLLKRLNANQTRSKNHNRSNVYMPKMASLHEIDQASKVLNANNFTWEVSADFYALLGNPDKYLKVMPNNHYKVEYKGLTAVVSKYGTTTGEVVKHYILDTIDKQGYVPTKNILDNIYQATNFRVNKRVYASIRQSIFDDYNLISIRANQSIKEQLYPELLEEYPKANSRPSIIVKHSATIDNLLKKHAK